MSINAFVGESLLGEGPKGNSQCRIALLPTDAEPFVVREKEIVQKTVALKPFEQKDGGAYITENHNVQFPIRNAGEGSLCFTVSLANVSRSSINADIQLVHYEFTQNGIGLEGLIRQSPRLLWHSTKYIFQSD
jgi:hypothetical protein